MINVYIQVCERKKKKKRILIKNKIRILFMNYLLLEEEKQKRKKYNFNLMENLKVINDKLDQILKNIKKTINRPYALSTCEEKLVEVKNLVKESNNIYQQYCRCKYIKIY